MGLMMDYVIALTHLYGLVHKDKVVEIYNMQNDEKIGVGDVESQAQDNVDAFNSHFVKIHGDYFVHDTILDFENFEQELANRQGKPFYIPTQKELLKYKKDSYVEKSVEYIALRKYVQRNFFNGDADKAEMLSEDVQGFCQYAFSISKVFESFDRSGVVFDSEEQVGEVMELVMDLANNTRLWENNGLTPNELSNQNFTPTEKAKGTVVHKKIGRNEPCPCGSGKKHKKCCG